ncbi:Omp28-related outer membrane protein [Aequorivita marina]|uniref:T9SS type A sorting domain-containing protein n=1 Tax=Aequorivita marina TaxID=3073654 RepID=UPI002876D1B3|nr:Omp28-related outer membrane protein [Aequorivita sp. S2608]MDS1298252.1 Omp28-related outer membrane protein [Aequorivita sp. S2608]
MLKKLLLSSAVGLFAFATYGQTIVSTSPEDQNVVLEEYTGIYCGYCPDGHAIAQAIQDANPDRVSLINIHQGGYANPSGNDPDFRTPWGNAIVNQSYSGGGFGYPSGSVNRHEFPGRSMASGGGTAMSRSFWTTSANETLAEPSPVNVAVEASIDINTKVLTVHVEGYYTSDSPEATNKLNVALLQNNTRGPQSGGGQGSNYNHMHRLVDLLTGQWGEDITTTTSGTFVDRTFTYPIPEDYNGIPTALADMEVVAFITNTRQEIPSGSSVYPSYTGLVYSNDASISSIAEIPSTCDANVAPEISVENLGQDPITSLEIEYIINGETNTYNWTGNILSLHSETIELPEVSYTLQGTNTVEVSLPDDENNANNSTSVTFDEAPAGTGTVQMVLNVDNRGTDIRWYVYNSNGTAVYRGGPYENGNPQTVYEMFELPEDCYEFRILDTASNGGGAITLTDSDGTVLYETDGNYGNGERSPFSSNGVLAVNQNEIGNISLYPNPATSTINLRNAENAYIQVFNVLGKMIFEMDNIAMDQQIDVAKLQTGTYFMKISKDNKVFTKRFLVTN